MREGRIGGPARPLSKPWQHKSPQQTKILEAFPCPSDQRIAQTVRLFERKPEDRSNKPRCRADDERQEREYQQAAVALRGV
jgi:hypothetical protein